MGIWANMAVGAAAWVAASCAGAYRKVRGAGYRIGQAAADLVFPPRCANCGVGLAHSPVVLLCESCRPKLGPATWHGCARCGGAVASGFSSQGGCALCRNVRFSFDAVLTLGGYHGELKQAILRSKHAYAEPLAVALAGLFVELRRPCIQAQRPELVIPVPMHWRRRVVRGANSADAIAGEIARRLGLPVCPRVLRRRRNDTPQRYLRPAQRYRNVRGTFAVRRATTVKQRRVLLVDDVLTTGATASEAARMLKRGGASYVVVAVLARAEGDDRP